MREDELRAAVERKRSATSYGIWTIGVTDDPDRRKGEHGNPAHWSHWSADSESMARKVEQYFIDKGMKGGTGGAGTARYVYMF
jgi:hypothetical protein